MKSLFKVTLLATTMAVALHAPITFAAEAAKPATTADSKAAFKNDDQKSAYALGASLGRYMENSLKEQEKLGIKLDKDQLIAGVQVFRMHLLIRANSLTKRSNRHCKHSKLA